MNNFEHAARLTELTDMGAHELAKRVIELENERDALAAHVERLREDVYHQANTILGEFGVRETIEDYLPKSYNNTPATSLARRDLIKQAEVLEAAESYAECKHDALVLSLTANKLRHQASSL